MTGVSTMFSDFQTYLTDEHDIREEIKTIVREIEQASREIHILLQPMHQTSAKVDNDALCKSTEPLFAQVKELFVKLGEKIPENQYYRYNDLWRFNTQRLSFLAALVVYLSEERLATREEVAKSLGVKVKREDGFHMDLDDYLLGLLNLTSEMSRLAMNAVTAGDFSRPIRISQFVAELDSGFRLLNLKNDFLRKRFDGLKYDVKKCEEIVYDLTIRGLVNKSEGE